MEMMTIHSATLSQFTVTHSIIALLPNFTWDRHMHRLVFHLDDCNGRFGIFGGIFGHTSVHYGISSTVGYFSTYYLGGAMLAHLYRELSEATRPNRANIVGSGLRSTYMLDDHRFVSPIQHNLMILVLDSGDMGAIYIRNMFSGCRNMPDRTYKPQLRKSKWSGKVGHGLDVVPPCQHRHLGEQTWILSYRGATF
ncbi:hypothetical protein M5K25_003219 [Dendrobium thyrsiflorum]|uniref:Uncharacterized protein n=1 Tax=Dendrobium thyrsiflorum TaxID=117978 RepID=A0ABD0VQB0_DENTH